MKCTNCGTQGVTLERVVTVFSPKIPDVMADGLERGHCPHCGEDYVGVPRSKELIDTIVATLIAKRWRLASGEIRFLRSALSLRADELAETLGVTPSQISRWENAAPKGGRPVQMSVTADRLLRVLVANHRGLATPELRGIDPSHAQPLAFTVRLRRRWKLVESSIAQVA